MSESMNRRLFVVVFSAATWIASAVPSNAQDPPATPQASGVRMVSSASAVIQALPGSVGVSVANIDAAETDAALARAVRRGLVERTVADPQVGTGTQGATQHQIAVVAEQGEVSGRARFYLPVGNKADWIVTFTGPLSGKNATFATESGLGRNASLNVAFKVTLWSYEDAPTSARASNQANTVASVGRTLGAPSTSAALEALRRVAVATGGLRVTSPQRGAAQLVEALNTAGNERLVRILESQSIVNSPERFWIAVAQDPTIVKTTWSASLTPSYEVNRSAGDYLTEAYAEETYDERTGLLSVAGGVSRVATVKKPGSATGETVNTPLFFVGGSIRGGNAVTIPDEQNICLPVSGGGSRCLDLPVGVIAKSDFFSGTFEFRYWQLDRSFGINPRYTYSRQTPEDVASTRVHTVEVPIYLMHKVSDVGNREFDFGTDLIGGVNVGWRNSGKNKGAFVMVFLSKAFGLP